jgi:hypothetical protein
MKLKKSKSKALLMRQFRKTQKDLGLIEFRAWVDKELAKELRAIVDERGQDNGK